MINPIKPPMYLVSLPNLFDTLMVTKEDADIIVDIINRSKIYKDAYGNETISEPDESNITIKLLDVK